MANPPRKVTVMQAFAEYVDTVYTGVELVPQQATELRRAFVAGTYFLLGFLQVYIGADETSEEASIAVLEAIKAECESFGAAVGTGAEPPQPPRSDNLGSIEVGTIFGMRSQRGIVELVVDGHRAQLDVAKAREVTMMLLQATEAAISDEVFVRFMQERVGLDQQRAVQALAELRVLRQGGKETVHPS